MIRRGIVRKANALIRRFKRISIHPRLNAQNIKEMNQILNELLEMGYSKNRISKMLEDEN